MKKPTVEEVLQQGLYGALETKPEERRKFLGTLRERIIVALNKIQVRERKVYPQVERYMKEYPKARLFLNGNMEYGELSKYVKIAQKYKVNYKIVTNKEHDTDIGLVLALENAIDKEEIFIKMAEVNEQPKVKKSLISRIFKGKRS